MVPRSTIHKQKKEFFALVSVSLCLPLPTPTFPRMTLKCSRSSAGRCNNSMRRSRGPSFNYKRQCKPIVQSVWLRKPGEKWRPRPRKRPRGRGLWRRMMEYLQHLQNEVLEEEAALLEGAERSQVVGSKRKEVAAGDEEGQRPSKKASVIA